MKKTVSIILVFVFIVFSVVLTSCNTYRDMKNAKSIEEIIKTKMLVNDGKYFIGYPYGALHFAEIRANGDKIDIMIYTPSYSSHAITEGDFEIYVCEELTSYCQKLYFEHVSTTFEPVGDVAPGLGSMYMTGYLYYISQESGMKIKIDLTE